MNPLVQKGVGRTPIKNQRKKSFLQNLSKEKRKNEGSYQRTNLKRKKMD